MSGSGFRYLAIFACLIATACNPSSPLKPQPIIAAEQTVEAEASDVTFAYIAGQDVQIATVNRTGIHLQERVTVPLTPFALHWIDNERLAILTHNDEVEPAKFELLIYANKRLQPIQLPDSEAWNVPHDDDYSAHDVGGAFLDTHNGELWMRRCAGGYLGDADGCTTFSYVRILPTVLEKQTVAPKDAKFGIRFVDPPQDVHVEVVYSEEDASSTIVCKHGLETSNYRGSHYTGDDSVPTFMPDSVFWVSQEPPIYAINETDESGEGLFYYFWLFSPCKSEPHSFDLVAEYEFVYGPTGVWAAGRGIYFENHRVGEINFEGADIPRYSGPAVAFSRSL